ncbi:MAG TPA: cyclopropane-fatty-acyl-phospholipid synthase family protein [Burkholderiaceae bacterium]
MPPSARIALAMLAKLRHGTLRLRRPDGTTSMHGEGGETVALDLRNWKVCGAAVKSGDIGFAESYIAGDWNTDNLPGLIELFVRNREAIEDMIYGSWWGNVLYRLKHTFNRNSKSGSRKNIQAHYDLGNDFYALWLDASMTYSSALFEAPQASLEQAQAAKYRRMLDELGLEARSNILEIGCGWGGFAETAVREGGHHVTGLTLSTEQLAYARSRLERAGLERHADLRLQDYRDLTGSFDGVASIEMFEAVGEAYWPQYFSCVGRALKPGGRACIQSIVIADDLFAQYRKGTDFIQQYIFPGGMLPCPRAFREQAARQGLRVSNELAFGQDYARTLQLWREQFKVQLAAVREQGFDERFVRTWEFYLAYCEAGFRAGSLDVIQFTLEKE